MQEKNFVFEGLEVHYLEGGASDAFPILMLHGSGPGVSSIGNWRKVLEPLSSRFHVYAMDLIGFGKSKRKPAPPYFDMALWIAQTQAMIAKMPAGPIGLIGHSISGAMALKLAALDSRIVKVMTTGCMGIVFTPNVATEQTWTFPKNRAELQRAAENLIHDKSLIDEAYLLNREKVLFDGEYEGYFGQMFGGDKRKFVDAAVLSADELGKIHCDVLMVHGRNDLAFPPELTEVLSRSIPQADVVMLGNCSHSVAFEHPGKFISLANNFFETTESASVA